MINMEFIVVDVSPTECHKYLEIDFQFNIFFVLQAQGQILLHWFYFTCSKVEKWIRRSMVIK